jgi:hypothetical protein
MITLTFIILAISIKRRSIVIKSLVHLLLVAAVAGCSPATDPDPKNPLLLNKALWQAIYEEGIPEVPDYWNKPKAKFSGTVTSPLTDMEVSCAAAIEHNDPVLSNNPLDPNACDRLAAQIAHALSTDMKMKITPENVKDAAFWREIKAYKAARFQRWTDRNAAKHAAVEKGIK